MAARTPHVFEVDLGPLQLSAAAVANIERAIQKAVLLELAQVDEAPGYAVAMSRPEGTKVKNPFFPFPSQRTRGIVFGDPKIIAAGDGE